METIELNCDRCHKPFPRKASKHEGDLKRGQVRFYCSNKCRYGSELVECAWCGIPVHMTRSQVQKSWSGRHYCSIDHANKHSGMLRGKKCVDCGKSVWSTNERCMPCYRKTIRYVASLKKSDVPRSIICDNARKAAKKHGLLAKCAKCDYTVHVDTCHKKPVADFPGDTLIAVINDPNNLVGLCTRCHWELDHGVLLMKDITAGDSRPQ